MRDNIFTAARDAVRPKPVRVFYTAPLAAARVLCSVFLLVMMAMYAVQFCIMPVAEAEALLLPLAPLIGVGILGEIVLALVLSRLSPIRIGDEGITLTDVWGHPCTLSWGEIETVTAERHFGIPCMKVASFRKDRTVLRVPLQLTRPQDFREAVCHFASPVNPVRRFVEGEVSVQREPAA